jgi:transcriptional regulator with XRE-family HTH domain
MAVAYKTRGIAIPHLSEWRISRVMSQSELADKASVARSTITRAERGEIVSFENVRKIAQALSITPQQLQHAPTEGGA